MEAENIVLVLVAPLVDRKELLLFVKIAVNNLRESNPFLTKVMVVVIIALQNVNTNLCLAIKTTIGRVV